MVKFNVISADPPYSFLDSLKMSDSPRGAESNYSVMSNKDILDLDVKSLAADDGCLLALWVPSSLLQLGLDIMKAWGFEQKQVYVWAKTKKEPLVNIKKIIKKEMKNKSLIGDIKDKIFSVIDNFDPNGILAFYMGRLFRQCHEICLIGINNNGVYKKLTDKSQRSVSFAENIKHSSKSDHLYDSLKLMFKGDDVKFLEIFGRKSREGWVVIGNESPDCFGEDVRDSIERLKKT